MATVRQTAGERASTLARLRASMRRTERTEESPLASEAGPLDRALGPGWRAGGTTELCGPGAAALTLAAWLAARAEPGRILLIDPEGTAHPAAFEAIGLKPARLVLVRPADRWLALWAAEQALRCPGVAVTLCRLGPRLGTVVPRRLKLAAEAGGGMGLFVRPAAREPPFSDVRLVVRPVPSEGKDTLRPRLEVEAVYQRGGTEGVRCVVELSADARLVSVPAAVARPAGPRLRIG